MAATITSRINCGVLITGLVVVFSIGSFAQSRSAATPPDLNSALAELMRVAPAANQDLAILQQQSGGILHRVTFWRGEKTQNAKISEALHRNLQFAVPSLIHETQASGGSISTTFKLYEDLTVVCDSLDSLLPPGSRETKAELIPLNNDLSDMNRLKEELSSYIQRTAVSIESRHAQVVSSANRTPKRIIVDDNIPERTSPRKRHTSNQ